MRCLLRSALPLAILLTAWSCAASSVRGTRPSGAERAPELPAVLADLGHHPDAAPLLRDARGHRIQILVAEVDESDHVPVLVRHPFRLSDEYFYPASAIKLCGAVAAVEYLNELARDWSHELPTLDTPLRIYPLFEDEVLEQRDRSNRDRRRITLRHELRKLFLVSDNRAYDRAFEFAGHEFTNHAMHRAGLYSARCVHRLSERRSFSENLRSPRIKLLVGSRPLTIPARTSDTPVDSTHLDGLSIGSGWVADGRLVWEPMDFHRKNSISVRDLQDALVKVVRPDVDLGSPPFDLSDAQHEFLRRAMSQLPRESENPVYDREEFPDDHVKFLLDGLARVVPVDELRVYNKVGRAYGFSVENAYVVHEPSGRSFFVTAVLYTNPNGILNDGDYAYEDLADPWLEALGEVLARRFFSDLT